MRLGGILQRIFLVHRNLYGATLDNFEQMVGDVEQVGAFGGISVERRPRSDQRSFGLQDVDVERFDLAGGALALLEKALEYGSRAPRGYVYSSPDPRALRLRWEYPGLRWNRKSGR